MDWFAAWLAWVVVVVALLWVADHCPAKWGDFFKPSKWRTKGRFIF